VTESIAATIARQMPTGEIDALDGRTKTAKRLKAILCVPKTSCFLIA
jgi:hypothetical protein